MKKILQVTAAFVFILGSTAMVVHADDKEPTSQPSKKACCDKAAKAGKTCDKCAG